MIIVSYFSRHAQTPWFRLRTWWLAIVLSLLGAVFYLTSLRVLGGGFGVSFGTMWATEMHIQCGTSVNLEIAHITRNKPVQAGRFYAMGWRGYRSFALGEPDSEATFHFAGLAIRQQSIAFFGAKSWSIDIDCWWFFIPLAVLAILDLISKRRQKQAQAEMKPGT